MILGGEHTTRSGLVIIIIVVVVVVVIIIIIIIISISISISISIITICSCWHLSVFVLFQAARNCLVGDRNQVKVGDFGLARFVPLFQFVGFHSELLMFSDSRSAVCKHALSLSCFQRFKCWGWFSTMSPECIVMSSTKGARTKERSRPCGWLWLSC